MLCVLAVCVSSKRVKKCAIKEVKLVKKADESCSMAPQPIILGDQNYLDSITAQAYALAERQIQEGTASSQVLVQFLRMGDPKTRAENEKLKKEIALLQEKIETLQQARKNEESYTEVIKALKLYGGGSGG